MKETDPNRWLEFRAVIEEFIDKNLESKLKELKKEGVDGAEKQEELRKNWLSNAAQNARRLQMATHVPKATHSASKGSSIYCHPKSLPQGTYVLKAGNQTLTIIKQ